ncbi:hypothetical protein ASC66_12810 [Leifsonia sp. Root4]|uniref:hypothetical protein n=1 Tax=Leifsonia sp. Root4 TaxID=1736525 RepID=UPI000700BD80|nr:hypothetical protein [Leifsonia sp. Root4]KQW05824.1 hypothetical protein ASC66_12810 [Leifsonia sp. Root4]
MRESERSRQPEATSVDPADPSTSDQSNPEQPGAEQAPTVDPAEQAAAERKRAEADAAAWAPKSAQTPAAPFAGDAEADVDASMPEADDDNDFGDFIGVPERTLTRRELRALLAAQAAARGEQIDELPESSTDDAHTADAVAPQPPIGHWSLDIDVEDDADDQSFDQVLSRGVGAGGVPTTTNALILPMIPQQGGDSNPIAGGEMLVTGSIDLPSLGDTGAHPNLLDSPDVDRLLDQVDDAHPATSAQPVRASRAVSTHTSTRDTLTPPKQGGLNVPTVLAITAAVLALGVIGLFIGGYIFKIF